MEGVIKELIDRRVKLKLAENLAEELAEHVGKQMNERERRLRRCAYQDIESFLLVSPQ